MLKSALGRRRELSTPRTLPHHGSALQSEASQIGSVPDSALTRVETFPDMADLDSVPDLG